MRKIDPNRAALSRRELLAMTIQGREKALARIEGKSGAASIAKQLKAEITELSKQLAAMPAEETP